MNWLNYDDVLTQLRDGGLQVDSLEVDTPKSQRCRVDGEGREKRGWYWLHEILLNDDGEMNRYIVGAWGVFHGPDAGTNKVLLRRDGKVRKLDPAQREAINRRRRENQKRLKAQRQAEADRAARRAASAWRRYEPQGQSEYLGRKGVEAFGLRFAPSGNGTLAVPMTDANGKVWGLQVIRSKRRAGQLEKEYWPKGLMKTGRFHLIGGRPRGVLLVAEGYATGATLHQATGLPVAAAFDAGNLPAVAVALAEHYRGNKILIAADDDYRTAGNPGVSKASEAALAVGGRYLAPVFEAERPTDRKGPTDWNDLHQIEGLHQVRAQVDGFLAGIGWSESQGEIRARDSLAGGVGIDDPMPSRINVDDAVARYWGTYGLGGKVLFDELDRRLVHKDDVLNLLPRHGWDDIRSHPDWRVAREDEIGFDPTQADPVIRCNLYGGWPTEAKAGSCERTLELLQYLCNGDPGGQTAYDWLIRWLAYPIQHPGAKLQTAVVMHGPQGTGKSLVFEAVVKIYGRYGRVLGQEALEDKFNADWSEKKLFILADEILARTDMWHLKNRLKGFITGNTIRVNPKNMPAHNEKNCMNIVFLSNEHQPVALERDDRRHCVIWTPEKLDQSLYDEVTTELENGGVEALHHHLLNLDLGDFRPWTKPPITQAKHELIHLGLSSEERFIRDWRNLDIEDQDAEPLPFCPCLGSHLYRAYEQWCKQQGETRPRPSNQFLNMVGKQPGWTAGKAERTEMNLNDSRRKIRKMVIPSEREIADAVTRAEPGSKQEHMGRRPEETKSRWLTRGFYEFSMAMGWN